MQNLLITLITDFGQKDPDVALTKGIILNALPEAKIIDISHDLFPFFYPETSYLLSSTYQYYPQHTFHIILSDIYAVKNNELLFVSINNQYLVLFNNGLLTLQDNNKSAIIHQIADNSLFYPEIIAKICETVKEIVYNSTINLPLFNGKIIKPGEIPYNINNNPDSIIPIHIDNYGNIVLNPGNEKLKLQENKNTLKIHNTDIFSEIHFSKIPVKEGTKYLVKNIENHLQINITKGNASQLLGISLNNTNNNITIVNNDKQNSKNDLFR